MATTHNALHVEIQALKRRIGGGGGGGVPDDHAASHQNGGSDEINVAGLSGALADPQTPASHTHPQSEVTNLVADLALKAPLASPAFTGTPTGITKSHVGLGNVDNTTDVGKPVSTAQQTALDAKQATLVSATNIKTINGATVLGAGDLVVGGAVAWGGVTGTLSNQTDLQTALDGKQASDADLTTIAGLTATTDNFMVAAASAWASRTPAQAKTSLALVKGDVGLGNVDNTTDAGKPVSTATQTALDLKANLASPTFTGTVTLPAQTVTLAMQANMATASVVYRKTAGAGVPEVQLLTTLKTDLVLVKGDVGLGSVDNTTDAGKPVSTATQTALDLKANLAGPTFTGVPAAPTAAVGTNTTQLATTAYARAMPLDTLAAPTDITTLNASTSVHGLLQKLPGGTATFLRADGAFAAPTAAASISQTEIDFGVTPVAEASFLITDANVSPSSKLIGTVAYVAPTGKDLDELDMDGLDLKFAPGSGQFTLYARGLDGYVADRFVINYQAGA